MPLNRKIYCNCNLIHFVVTIKYYKKLLFSQSQSNIIEN